MKDREFEAKIIQGIITADLDPYYGTEVQKYSPPPTGGYTPTDDVDLPTHWGINEDVSWIRHTATFNLPKEVGKYKVNGELHFHFTHRPNWFHRKMTRLLLGWKWEDIK